MEPNDYFAPDIALIVVCFKKKQIFFINLKYSN